MKQKLTPEERRALIALAEAPSDALEATVMRLRAMQAKKLEAKAKAK